MSQGLLIDTHVFLWLFEQASPLSKSSSALVEQAASEGELWLSAISLWEIAMLAHKQRIMLEVPVNQWLKDALGMWHCRIATLDADVAAEAYAMPGEFHGDPADRMIVATARVYDIPLMTADKLIQQYTHNNYIVVEKT